MRIARPTLLFLLTFAIPACGGANTAVGIGTPTESTNSGSSQTSRAPIDWYALVQTSEPWQDLEVSPGLPDIEDGAAAIRALDWMKASEQLEKAIAEMNDSTPLDEVLVAHALLGRACAAVEDRNGAEAAYGFVRAKWNGIETAQKVVEAAGNDKAARKRRLRRALLAVGEAYYDAAEQKRKAANAPVIPVYSGPGSKESVDKYISEPLGQWVKEKQRLVDEAEAAYAKINEIKPAPPPRWVVSASARVATLWGKFTAEYRTAPLYLPLSKGTGPVPDGNGITYEEIKKSFYAAIDRVAEPERKRTRQAYEKCQSDSAKYKYADALTRSCDQWLAKSPAVTP